MNALMEHEALISTRCACERRRASWRCKECHQRTMFCRECMRNAHLEMPFHRIQKWTGQYFRPGSLWEVGVCVIVDHGNTDRRCEWLKHKADEQIRLQATCDSQDEGEDEVEEVEDTYRDRRADADITVEQRDGGVEERFDIDEIIEELEKEEARHAHGGEEDLDGADEEDEGKAGLPEAPIDHPIAPSMDPDQNPYVLFVHTNGLHSLPYIQCGCGGPQERIAGAVRMRLMPASFTIFKTMFTFDVLEDFRLANLECKTSAYQYYQLLRRKTEPLAPQVVVERYAELRRLSRCWRWLKKLKWGGRNKTRESDGNTIGEVRTAELAPFCPCCPQPGVNLPDNWKEDENKCVMWLASES